MTERGQSGRKEEGKLEERASGKLFSLSGNDVPAVGMTTLKCVGVKMSWMKIYQLFLWFYFSSP